IQNHRSPRTFCPTIEPVGGSGTLAATSRLDHYRKQLCSPTHTDLSRNCSLPCEQPRSVASLHLRTQAGPCRVDERLKHKVPECDAERLLGALHFSTDQLGGTTSGRSRATKTSQSQEVFVASVDCVPVAKLTRASTLSERDIIDGDISHAGVPYRRFENQ
ncbi:hypothetical protein X777_10186, partial [Ooceraea biroi]